MPYITFTFENTNSDQSFQYWDERENGKNYSVGMVNHNNVSRACQCWQGSDGKGRIRLQGSSGPDVNYDIYQDGERIRY